MSSVGISGLLFIFTGLFGRGLDWFSDAIVVVACLFSSLGDFLVLSLHCIIFIVRFEVGDVSAGTLFRLFLSAFLCCGGSALMPLMACWYRALVDLAWLALRLFIIMFAVWYVDANCCSAACVVVIFGK